MELDDESGEEDDERGDEKGEDEKGEDDDEPPLMRRKGLALLLPL